MAYTFHAVPTTYYGQGAFAQLATIARAFGQHALVVTDPVMEKLGVVAQCTALLEKGGVRATVYSGVLSEPTDTYVAQGLQLIREAHCDFIVSIGGGSCLDTAKAIAIVATNDGYIGDYMQMKKVATIRPLAHIAIPTTAGTGSEATDVTVITDTTNDIKMMIKQPALMPAVAIVDPLLSATSPPAITAATGIDALSHAIEAYLSRRAHPYSDTLALAAMALITKHLLPAYENGQNTEAREAMALGAMQAGAAFSNASVSLVHGMSRPIGALFHVPHGISNAMLLPMVLEYSKDACLPRLAQLGRFFTAAGDVHEEEALAQLAIDEVKQLCRAMSIPNLRGYGIDEQQFLQSLDKMATDALASGSPANNPKISTFDELKTLYKIAYDYEF